MYLNQNVNQQIEKLQMNENDLKQQIMYIGILEEKVTNMEQSNKFLHE